MVKYLRLNTIKLFAILTSCFPPYSIFDSCSSHQITLVSGIDECFTYKGCSIQRFKGKNFIAFHVYSSRQTIKPSIAVNHDLVFTDHLFKCSFSNMGLKQPHGLVSSVIGNSSLPTVTKSIALLPFPCTVCLIMVVQAVVKIPGQSTNDGLVASVGVTQTIG